MEKYLEKEWDFPIFEAKQIKDKIILSGGGGGQAFGVPDQIRVISGNSFETLFSTNTPVIYEKTLLNDIDDFIIVVSEKSITLFELSLHGKLEQKDVLEFNQNNTGYTLMTELVNDKLVVSDHMKNFYVFEIRNKKFHQSFTSDINEKVLGFIPHVNANKVLFVFSNKLNVFDFVENKFIEVSFEFKEDLKKVFWFYTEDKEFLVLLNTSPSDSTAFVFKKSKTRSLAIDLVTKQKLTNNQITSVGYKEQMMAISTVEGIIIVFKFSSTASFYKLYAKPVHLLPVRSIILRKMPTTYGDTSKLLMLSFGIDYKMIGHLLTKKESGSGGDLVKMTKVLIFIILLIAIIIGIFKR